MVSRQWSLKDLNENYDLELDKVSDKIKKNKGKFVLLQFPDGLKPYASVIVNYLEKENKNVEFLIWFGTCFGACDLPVGLENLSEKIDLTIQFGHNDLMPDY